MATRYVPAGPVFLPTKHGHDAFFDPNRIDPNGLRGYSAEDLAGLTAQQIKDHFHVHEETVVEQATSAPGEKRAVVKK
jgi:hypothetical protein